jgi:hypothetical protein
MPGMVVADQGTHCMAPRTPRNRWRAADGADRPCGGAISSMEWS